MNSILDTIKFKSDEYLNEINEILNNNTNNQETYFTEKIVNFLNSEEVDKNSLLRECSLINTYNEAVGTVNIGKNKVYLIYNNKNYETLKINFTAEMKRIDKILTNSRYLNLKTRIVITGGLSQTDEETPTKFAYYIHHLEDTKNERKAKPLADMIYTRDQHTMIQLNDFYLMCIGGYNTDKCEILNLVSNTWSEKPSLNKVRYNSSAFLHNEVDLYVFFGLLGDKNKRNKNEFIYNDDIERLRLCDNGKTQQWELLKVNFDPNILNKEFSMFGIIPHGEEIIILGGKTNLEKDYSSTFYKFKFDNTELSTFNNKKVNQKFCFPDSHFVRMQFQDDANNKFKSQWVSYSPELVLYAVDIV